MRSDDVHELFLQKVMRIKMKKSFIRTLALALALLTFMSVVPFTAGAHFAKQSEDFYLTVEENPDLPFNLSSYLDANGDNYLFLPGNIELDTLIVRREECLMEEVIGGELVETVIETEEPVVDEEPASAEDGEEGETPDVPEEPAVQVDQYIIVNLSETDTIYVDGETLIFMQGSLPSLHVDIKAGYSSETIYADKDAKIQALASIYGTENGEYDLAPKNIEIKTRGNSTWAFDKKPFQIKFDKKQDLFGMGKAKKWILLANYVDGTMIRNKVIFDLGEKIGMPYTCQSVFVDLYMDGEYLGVYQLCEKVEIGDSRVPLENDYGVIIEMDANRRVDAAEEIHFITYTTEKAFVYKEYVTDFEDTETPEVVELTNKVKDYIEFEVINPLEEELYYGGDNWELIESLIDVDSFIHFYFINEFAMQCDATFSSTYFYTEGPGDKLHCGPLWDYDRSFGIYEGSGYEQGTSADFLKNIIDCTDEQRVEWFKLLFRYPEFVKRVNEIYDETIRDAFNAEEICNSIDEYEAMLLPSLKMNHVKWVVFHTINDLAPDRIGYGKTTEEYLDYTVGEIKKNIANRKDYLDTAYGEYMPTLMFTTYANKKWRETLSGGSMSFDNGSVTGFYATLEDGKIDGGVEYSIVYQRNYSDYAADGVVLGGSADTPFNGISMRLTGNVANYYSVQYRVMINGRWSGWAQDGNYAGRTSGSSNLISRVQARLIKRSGVEIPLGTIVFNTTDTSAVENIESVVGNSITELPVPVKKGYRFDGWYENADLSGEAVESVTVAAETNLYAKMTAVYEAIFGDANGDGRTNALDVIVIKKAMSGNSQKHQYIFENADVDGNGSLNSRDIIKIRKELGN